MNANLRKFLQKCYKRLLTSLLLISINDQSFIARGMGLCNKKLDHKNCHVFCANLNLNSKNDTAQLEAIMRGLQRTHRTCTLKLENCSHRKEPNQTCNSLNLQNNPKIKDLKIIDSTINLSDAGLCGLKNLKRLTLTNTTTVHLDREIFRNLSNLRELRIENNKFLKSIERNFLRGTQLEYIKIQRLNLNETETKKFFSNLTEGFQVPSIRRLDWSYNKIGYFAKEFLKNFPNLNSLILTDANISNIEEGAFNYGQINRLHLENNKLERLPEKVFKTIMKNATGIFLTGNNLICDCQMEWLQNIVNRVKGIHFGDFQNLRCGSPSNSLFLYTQMCSERQKQVRDFNETHKSEAKITCNTTDGTEFSFEIDNLINKTPRRFNITNEASEFIDINISQSLNLEETFLWLINFTNYTSPEFNCMTISKQNLTIGVTPESNYLLCLARVDNFMKTHIFDCLPFKTKPTYENQTWLKRKSIFLSIISITFVSLFASALGALVLYLSIRKNPDLIRGSKRVIVVKRHDKAQLLIMPRGCENLNQTESQTQSQALMGFNQPLLNSRSSLNCDTVSTASYVSANQPTQLEILTYKLNRFQELFQDCNEFPSPVSPLPVVSCPKPQNQRLPPNVDLLFEYEWYTITTTTTSSMYKFSHEK